MKEIYLEKGFTDYLSKPIIPNKLEKMIQHYLPIDKKIVASDVEHSDFTEVESSNNLSSKDNIQSPLQKLKTLIEDVNLEMAMLYCSGSEDMYIKFLKYYAESGRYERILKAYQDMDINQYTLEIHTLKSTSKTLGFDKLSELAEKLHSVIKQNNMDSIDDIHNNMMKRYKDILSALEQII